eukprot:scaffold201895_cov42-Prasinocladus_malaysianus.AAC.1
MSAHFNNFVSPKNAGHFGSLSGGLRLRVTQAGRRFRGYCRKPSDSCDIAGLCCEWQLWLQHFSGLCHASNAAYNKDQPRRMQRAEMKGVKDQTFHIHEPEKWKPWPLTRHCPGIGFLNFEHVFHVQVPHLTASFSLARTVGKQSFQKVLSGAIHTGLGPPGAVVISLLSYAPLIEAIRATPPVVIGRFPRNSGKKCASGTFAAVT